MRAVTGRRPGAIRPRPRAAGGSPGTAGPIPVSWRATVRARRTGVAGRSDGLVVAARSPRDNTRIRAWGASGAGRGAGSAAGDPRRRPPARW